jgi:hypothetical protein
VLTVVAVEPELVVPVLPELVEPDPFDPEPEVVAVLVVPVPVLAVLAEAVASEGPLPVASCTPITPHAAMNRPTASDTARIRIRR